MMLCTLEASGYGAHIKFSKGSSGLSSAGKFRVTTTQLGVKRRRKGCGVCVSARRFVGIITVRKCAAFLQQLSQANILLLDSLLAVQHRWNNSDVETSI